MNIVTDWSEFQNFTRDEFKCSFTGKCYMNLEFMQMLQALRTSYGKPMIISSGYRDEMHPVERRKIKLGEHSIGKAADIVCHGAEAYEILSYALSMGFKRIGVSQKGEHGKRFIHLGIGDDTDGLTSPTIWSY